MTLWRCLTLWIAATALVAVAASVLVPTAVRAGADLPDLVVRVSAAALLGSGMWLWLLTTVVIHEAVRGGRRLHRVPVPTAVRRVVLLLCGASLAGGLAPAVAATAGQPAGPPPGLSHSGRSVVVAAPAAHHPVRRPRRVVVVRRGDSLWRLAAERIAQHAAQDDSQHDSQHDSQDDSQDDAAVTAGWHALYRRNRAVIGDDPDLIRPGERLALPDQLTQGDHR